jgi:hypothetical protein
MELVLLGLGQDSHTDVDGVERVHNHLHLVDV